ncbi:hypothetical protein [Maridesulfovibrio hydrothermalis]|uniref:Uncharacterized protein n=1 Tax=Maridesulfovibrio hydrothermalis AM13 = DSM 14728 TaxID=1121451 RepID=L0R602_9BACT|nr:hypothetical protein [Maridesulfovibrio hydrothermalis]CCO22118.1 conserved exported protein of unknown function [Maridesulfovibrio hydrothermalis AM13 = DSM 14728]
MKKTVLITVLLSGLIFAATCFAANNAPESIAGISIGSDVSTVRSLLDMDTARSPWLEEYAKKIQIRDMEGYRGGYVVIGNCNRPNIILRMKLKYADNSLTFFNKLYGKFEKRFGKPDDWRGNPFGTLKVWKWSLDDSKGNISLILQHFSGDDDSITSGNSIRLSRPSWIEDEKNCWNKIHPEPKQKPIPAKMKGLNWFLPY